jgi:uncharacterized protein
MSNAWIETFSGKRFHLLEPQPEDIDIVDIAHSSSLQCRWTGHCKHHYSIAQHAYYCSFLVPEPEALEALMHDSPEAYISDLSRPLKHYTPAGQAYRDVEDKIQAVIEKKFDLISLADCKWVKIADNQMLHNEKQQLMNPEVAWDDDWLKGQNALEKNGASFLIEQWSPGYAETMFLKRFKELYDRRNQCQ